MSFNQRLDYIDTDLINLALNGRIKSRDVTMGQIQDQSLPLSQVVYTGLAGAHKSIGLFSYALGHPFSDIIQSFELSSFCYLKVFLLMGSEDAIPMYTSNKSTILVDPINSSSAPPTRSSRKIDYSLTEPRKGLLAFYLAIISCNTAVLDNLAVLPWQPSAKEAGAIYCDVHPAYTFFAEHVKSFYLDQSPRPDLQFKRFAKIPPSIESQCDMLRAIMTGNLDEFLYRLDWFLDRHSKEAHTPKNLSDPDYFLCLPGLGLSALAIRQNGSVIDSLPKSNAYLPIELLISEKKRGHH